MYASDDLYTPYEDVENTGLTDEDMDEWDAYSMMEDAAMESSLFGDC